MSGELLLHWLSHLGEGTWRKFRDAVASMLPPEEDGGAKFVYWSNRLEELGHVDFFVDGSQRWRVRQPMLAGVCSLHGEAVLCGARSPHIVQTLEAAANKEGCEFVISSLPALPARVAITGTVAQITAVAKQCQLPYRRNYSEAMCDELPQLLSAPAPVEEEPAGWQVRSFDFRANKWINGRLPRTAREYESRFGLLRYFWCDQQNRLRPAAKREAIYASAAVQRVMLAQYNWQRRSLIMAAATPLPKEFMRAACLCSGMPPNYEGGELVVENVPPSVASLLLVSAGQPHPGVPMLRPEGFKEGLEANGRSVQAIRRN